MDKHFQTWNFELWAMTKQELHSLRSDGYSCVILGDFNGHVSYDVQGIPGNNPDVNFNWGLFPDFIEQNNLKLFYADQDICNRFFTRITSNSRSCLDYVLEDDPPWNLVSCMDVLQIVQY